MNAHPAGFSLSRRPADLVIMVGLPDKGRLRVRKLLDYTLRLYASKDYLARNGRPKELDDLKSHTLIGYVEDLIYTPELAYAQDLDRDWRSDIEVSTAIGQFEAVSGGAGIGICHDVMAAGKPGLACLFSDRSVTRSYWIVWHENLRVARRVRVVADLLDPIVRDESGRFSGSPM